MGKRHRGRLVRMREAGAATASPALLRPGDAADTSNPGAENDTPGSSGDGDEDDHTCPTCGGSAVKDGDVCPTCMGSGSVQDSGGDDGSDVQDMGEADTQTKTCPVCHGSGKVLNGNVTCKACNGTGKVPVNWKPAADTGNPFAKSKESTLSTKQRNDLPDSAFALPPDRYPIPDLSHAQNALARSSGKPEEAAVKAAVYKKFPQLKESDGGDLEARLARMEAKLDRVSSQNEQLRESHPDHLNAQFSGMARVKNSHGEDGYAVDLIREGLGNPADDAWYTVDAIQDMAESGRAEGMQAYANHPDAMEEANRPERDIRHLIGKHTDVKCVREDGGKRKATAVFVPLTTDERHPQLGWVTTLAEAAARNRGSQPLCGWSLFGLSAGDEGDRPDGSHGRMVDLILPQSADLVTNAGAGGGFARRLMQESARRLRRAYTTPTTEEPAMNLAEWRTQTAEAMKQLREASTDEQRAAATADVERLQEEAAKIDRPLQVPDSIEALTEAAPGLAAKLREAVKSENKDEVERLREENAELQRRNADAASRFEEIGTIRKISEAVRSALPKDASDDEHRRFVGMAQTQKLTEAADIREMVETDLRVAKAREDATLSKVREALGELDLPEIEGLFSRTPESGEEHTDDGGLSFLRESGVPVRAKTTA